MSEPLMVELQATRFWHTAIQSGLIDAPRLEACWAAIPPEKRTPDAIDRRLARQAIEAGHLTLWQAQQILSGRSQGFRIGKYVLLDKIGQGGMGRVYLAKDTRLNRQVAIKVLSPERMNNPRALLRFQREAKVGAQLQHEHLIRVYDEGESQGIYYLVMEYIDGKSVGQIINKNGPIRFPVAAEIARQVALGLDHANQKGTIHRDVNPWNILLTRDGIAKLTDLGLAIDLGDDDVVTRDGATVGTFDYISPEQARHSRSVDIRSDIYSLGCTLYHMLAGKPPFDLASLPEKLYAHQMKEAESIRSHVADVPEGLDAVVRRMMKKAMDDRYQSPLAVAEALEPFAGPQVPLTQIEAGSQWAATSPNAIASTASRTPLPGSEPELAPRPAAAPALTTPPEPGPETAIPQIDLGPEPGLSDNLSGVRSKRGSKSNDESGPPRLSDWPWAWIAVALAIVLALTLIVVVAVAVIRTRASRPTSPATDGDVSTTAAMDIATRGGDGVLVAAATLQDAMESVAGGRGEVVLGNAKPLRFPAAKALSVPGGAVKIRAAEGRQPVLVVEMDGSKPFLTSPPNSSLSLEGLTIQAETKGGEAKAPLILARGNLSLGHCVFLTEGEAAATTAVAAEGLKTSIVGCAFEGFDRALDLGLFGNAEASVSQSMMVWTPRDARQSGWAIRARLAGDPGPRPARRLTIDHLTVAGGGGLLHVEGFGPSSPLTVTVENTAVAGGALVLWGPPPSDFPKALAWSGRNNCYDIRKTVWVVVPPEGFDGLANGPTDLDAWQKATGETESRAKSLPFYPKPPADSTSFQPKDFTMPTEEGQVGADPNQVGPRA